MQKPGMSETDLGRLLVSAEALATAATPQRLQQGLSTPDFGIMDVLYLLYECRCIVVAVLSARGPYMSPESCQ